MHSLIIKNKLGLIESLEARFLLSVTNTTLQVSSNGAPISIDQNLQAVPIGVNHTIVLNASVQAVPTMSSDPTGNVDFLVKDVLVGSAALVAKNSVATASFQTILPLGKDAIVAVYDGSENYSDSTSGPSSVLVAAYSSTIVSSMSTNLLTSGSSEAFKIAVMSADDLSTIPSGTVTIDETDPGGDDGGLSYPTIGPTSYGPYALQSDGQFSVVLTPLSTTPQFTILYSGDVTYSPFASGTVSAEVPNRSAAVAGVYQWYSPSTVVSTQPFNAHTAAQIINRSGAKITGDFQLDTFASKSPSGLDGQEIPLSSANRYAALGIGARMNFSFSIRSLALGLSPGSYYLFGAAFDPTGSYILFPAIESFEVSNPVITLQAAASVLPANIKAGRTTTLIVSIKNSGNISADGPLSFVISATGINGMPITLGVGGVSAFVKIKAGKTGRYHLRIKVPVGTAPGTANLSVQATLASVTADAVASQLLTIK